ncbi:MAG: hypothetical protein AB1689_21560 [Thermodesulfobacteriota bacterium]
MDIKTLFPFAASGPPRGPVDVEQCVARLFESTSVDAGQVPMYLAARLDSGERRLALAVLEEALRCVLHHHGSRVRRQRTAAHEALLWIASDDDAPPFAFVRLCQLFDLDPGWIRDMVRRRMRRDRLEPARPVERAA